MLNKIILIGRLTRDPEIKTTTSGIEIATFSIAVQRDFKNAKGEYDTDFFYCVAYRNTAKFIGQHGYKGQLASIEGKSQNRSYVKDNQEHKINEIILEKFIVLEWKKDNPKPQSDIKTQADNYFNDNPNVDISEDDLPF